MRTSRSAPGAPALHRLARRRGRRARRQHRRRQTRRRSSEPRAGRRARRRDRDRRRRDARHRRRRRNARARRRTTSSAASGTLDGSLENGAGTVSPAGALHDHRQLHPGRGRHARARPAQRRQTATRCGSAARPRSAGTLRVTTKYAPAATAAPLVLAAAREARPGRSRRHWRRSRRPGLGSGLHRRGRRRSASRAAAVARRSAPASLARPSLQPAVPVVGGRTRCLPGKWKGAHALTYQWLRGGKPIASATAARYRVAPADRGRPLACRVTATATGGAHAAATSKRARARAGLGIGKPSRVSAGRRALGGAALRRERAAAAAARCACSLPVTSSRAGRSPCIRRAASCKLAHVGCGRTCPPAGARSCARATATPGVRRAAVHASSCPAEPPTGRVPAAAASASGPHHGRNGGRSRLRWSTGIGVSPSSSAKRRRYWSGRMPQPSYGVGSGGASPSSSSGSMRPSATRQMCSHESPGSNWYTNSSPTARRLSRELPFEHLLALGALPLRVLGCHIDVAGELELPQVREIPAPERHVDRGRELRERVRARGGEHARRDAARSGSRHPPPARLSPRATSLPRGHGTRSPERCQQVPRGRLCYLYRVLMAASAQAVEVAGVAVSFGETRALDGVDLDGRAGHRAGPARARTAPARRRSCACSRRCSGPRRAARACSAATSSATRRACAP